MIRTIVDSNPSSREHHYDFEMQDSKGRKIGASLKISKEARPSMHKAGREYMYAVEVTRDGQSFGNTGSMAWFSDPDTAYIEAMKKMRQIYRRYAAQARKAKRKAREAAQ